MKVFLSWETYNSSWILQEKGYHILYVDMIDNIDSELVTFVKEMAEAKGINPTLFIITTCQPLSLFP
jgi:glycosylphosphatidylinositol transamidase (GPIT) subunit GPI8